MLVAFVLCAAGFAINQQHRTAGSGERKSKAHCTSTREKIKVAQPSKEPSPLRTQLCFRENHALARDMSSVRAGVSQGAEDSQ